MPQVFNPAVLTNQGIALLNKAQAGQCKIEFVKMAVGSGSYATSEKTVSALQARTALKAEKNSYKLISKKLKTENSVQLTAMISNQDPLTLETLVTTGYYINEIALYAKESGTADSTAVIYSIAVVSGANGDFMPPYNGHNPAQITQDFIVTVSNSSTVVVNVAGQALPRSEFEALGLSVKDGKVVQTINK